MGRVKQLLPLGNKPAIRHCLDSIIAAGVRDIVVIIGPGSEEMAGALQGLPVTLAINAEHESEMVESVRTGLPAVPKSSSGGSHLPLGPSSDTGRDVGTPDRTAS